MDKKSKNILDNKAKAILREHLVAFETYDIAYIVNDGYEGRTQGFCWEKHY